MRRASKLGWSHGLRRGGVVVNDGSFPCNSSPLLLAWHNGRSFKRWHMGSHSHEHEEEAGEAGERVSRWGLIADVGLAAGKGVAGYISGSTAVLADAAHSFSDIVLSGVALWSIRAARAPKDEKHPYGHGKFETVGALGISSMLLLTGGGIAWHAIEVLQALMPSPAMDLSSTFQYAADHISFLGDQHGHGEGHEGHHHAIDMEHPGLALGVTISSIAIKEGLFWATKKVGESHGSELLKANAWHHRSDAISSFIALIGVGGAMLGLRFFDPVAGLFLSGMVIKAGVQSGYKSLQELVDSAVPDTVLAPFRETVMMVNGVKDCHKLRGRKAGSSIHLDAHIEVDPWISVSAAHMIREAACNQLRKDHPVIDEAFILIEPVDAHSSKNAGEQGTKSVKANCFHQLAVETAIRNLIQTEFYQKMALRHITCHLLHGRLLVDVEVCIGPHILIGDAMQYASDAEKRIAEVHPEVSSVTMKLILNNQLQKDSE